MLILFIWSTSISLTLAYVESSKVFEYIIRAPGLPYKRSFTDMSGCIYINAGVSPLSLGPIYTYVPSKFTANVLSSLSKWRKALPVALPGSISLLLMLALALSFAAL